jgi:N-acetylmuramoyl-L-alanine amidase
VRRAALLVVLLWGCAQQPPQQGMSREWLPSPNFGERRPNYVILHHTSSATAAHAAAVLTAPASGVSAHYLIGRDGRLFQLVDERMRAWHAGESSWGGNADLNSASIGIELDNDGLEPYAEAQVATLLSLLAELRERYQIPRANFLGHGDIAPRRKADPSRYFPWRRLAAQGFGLWCEAPAAPGSGDDALMLRAFGYDVSDPDAAIAAFRRHFRNEERAGPLDETERATLACLLKLGK